MTTHWTTIRDAEQAVNDGRLEGGSEEFRKAIVRIAWARECSVNRALCIYAEKGGDCEGFEYDPAADDEAA
jgi:hypothetical protein